MKYAGYVIMAIAIVGILFGKKKQKEGMPWGEQLVLLSAIVALVAAVWQLFFSGGPGNKRIMEIQLAYTKVSTQKLGEHLAATYPGSKAIVLVNPQMPYTQQQSNVLLEGLKAGLGNKITIVAEVAPKLPEMPNMPGMMPGMPPPPAGAEGAESAAAVPPGAPSPEMMMMMGPIEFWLTAEKFDEMMAPYLDKCDMVITTIGLPMDVGRMKFWSLSSRPKMVVASGSILELKKAIEGKAVVAALTFNPKAKFDNERPPKKLDDAFAKRYILITPENVNQVAEEIPELFIQMPPPPQ
jgi:hypothetical protein